MTAPNAELAYKVLDHIDAHPEQWEQGHWYGSDAECGTTACFAGWAVVFAGHQITLGEPGNDDGYRSWSAIDGDVGALISEVAAEDLGITQASEPCTLCGDCGRTQPISKRLFNGSNDREELGRFVAEIFGPRPHAPLCVDQPGHPHDNECECSCHGGAE